MNLHLHLTSQQTRDEVEQHDFAVLGMVTAEGESHTVGIVDVVDDHQLDIGADRTAWKTEHIEGNPHVSATVPLPERVPPMPWIEVPAATITFSGTARIPETQDLGAELLDQVYRHDDGRGAWCAIEMTPEKDFVTDGVGVSLPAMRSSARSRSRAPARPIPSPRSHEARAPDDHRQHRRFTIATEGS
ncbi:pyridoxamine 5'-phosphate oxidase family protein [Ilumatobacter sp.]|uniref:pyridoxamine 5'-phosphate oxidase family protein n=1 Tax=Ilumatobacter sp. TaxID=1967498 RepID=UPI003AF801C2